VKKFLKVVLLTIFTISALVTITVILLLVRYNNWTKDFESNLKVENLVVKDTSLSEEVVSQISSFTLSQENTESLSLSTEQFGYIVLNVLNEYLGEGISVEKIYIEPSTGNWNIYIQANYKKISPWIWISLKKDNVQSAQLYISQFNIGPYSFNRFVEEINDGIANGLVTVNENGFTGRYLENIELLEESIVVKGSRY
jgi:hypothetical protein